MNTRSQLTLAGSIIAVAGLGVGGVVSVVKSDVSHSTPAITSILGFAGTIIVSLFTLLKAEQNARLSQENKEALVQNSEELVKNRKETRLNRKRIIQTKNHLKTVEQQLQNVEKEISPDTIAEKINVHLVAEGNFPRTSEDLERIIGAIVSDICRENKDNNKQLHDIKDAVKNIAHVMNLKEEIRRLGGDPDEHNGEEGNGK